MVPRTIRARVTCVAVALTAVLLIVASALMLAVLRLQLADNLDENLSQRADTIEAVLGDTSSDELRTDEDLLVQVLAPDGTVLLSSSNLGGSGPISPLEPGFTSNRAVPDRPEEFRVLSREIEYHERPALLVVGVNRDDVTDPMRIISKSLAFAVPAVVCLLGGLTWWLTGRVLHPVDAIRAQMAEIGATNLGGRVPEPNTGDEISRLARTMNEALARVETAARRQQRFAADASHELRIPLTRIRTELEVDLAQPERADPIATERSVLAETIGLQHLVDDLLQLARADATDSPAVGIAVGGVAVDLDDIVLDEAGKLAERARVAVDISGVSAAQVTGAPSQLARAVQNLLDNAERHAMAVVTIILTESAGTARLIVSDDGVGIPRSERETVFERFTRLDEARTRDAGGTGLGLAITREIIERHGGSIRVADRPTTTFVVELPARP